MVFLKKVLFAGGALAGIAGVHAQEDMDFEMPGMAGGGEDIDPQVLEQLMAQMGGAGGMEGMDGMGMGGGMDFGSMMGGGMGAPREVFKPVKGDVKYILCQTCEQLIEQSFKRTSELKTSTPKSLFTEDLLDNTFENLCNTMLPEGTWITEFDMVETGDHIELQRQEGPGKCKEECKTMERACEKLMDEFSTDLIAQLYLGKKDLSQLTEEMCKVQSKRLKGSCAKPRPTVKPGRESGGDNFELKDESQLAMDAINQNFRMEHPDLAAPKHMVDEL